MFVRRKKTILDVQKKAKKKNTKLFLSRVKWLEEDQKSYGEISGINRQHDREEREVECWSMDSKTEEAEYQLRVGR